MNFHSVELLLPFLLSLSGSRSSPWPPGPDPEAQLWLVGGAPEGRSEEGVCGGEVLLRGGSRGV